MRVILRVDFKRRVEKPPVGRGLLHDTINLRHEPEGINHCLVLVRVEVVETSSQVWKTCILTAVLHSRDVFIITQKL